VTTILVDKGCIGFNRLEIVGYASMIIALSMVFFGISLTVTIPRRNPEILERRTGGGLISLIAGVLYWFGASHTALVNPVFDRAVYEAIYRTQSRPLQAQVLPAEQIDKAKAEVDMMAGLFKNPVLFFLVCQMEILPLGLSSHLSSARIAAKA